MGQFQMVLNIWSYYKSFSTSESIHGTTQKSIQGEMPTIQGTMTHNYYPRLQGHGARSLPYIQGHSEKLLVKEEREKV